LQEKVREMHHNIQIKLAETPTGTPEPKHFDVHKETMPDIKDGEFLSKTLYLSLDPYMRGQIAGRHISGSVNPGDILRGEAICEVVNSKHPEFAIGDIVSYFAGWQQFSVSDGQQVSKIDPRISPPSLALGILGMPGLTAYAGLIDLGEPKEGDVLVVSSATGGVGSMVGQIGKVKGCQVVGIAGSAEKCKWAVENAGFDVCLNYREEDLPSALDKSCPDGVDIYFDNVGGNILETVMERLSLSARVVLCGLMAQYNLEERLPGTNPSNIIRSRATVRGMVVYDHFHKQKDFVEDVLNWLDDGLITYREDVTEGIENAPESFCRLMKGQNFGKTIIKVA
jgi:NADPH-dependent curcumin reductase CurA